MIQLNMFSEPIKTKIDGGVFNLVKSLTLTLKKGNELLELKIVTVILLLSSRM